MATTCTGPLRSFKKLSTNLLIKGFRKTTTTDLADNVKLNNQIKGVSRCHNAFKMLRKADFILPNIK